MAKSKQLIFTQVGDEVTKNLSDLPELRHSNDIVPVKEYKTYDNRIVSKEFTLPAKIFKNESSLIADLHFLDKDGIRKSKEKIGLNNGKEIYDLTDPKIPPQASAKLLEDDSRKISYTITQKDPYGESVNIYYRLFSPCKAYTPEESEYKFLKKVKVIKDETVLGQCVIPNVKGKIVIIRFVTQSILQRPGAFRDAVVLQQKKSESTRKRDVESTFMSINGSIVCDVNGMGIAVKLLNVSSVGFQSLRLCRKMLQKSELGTVHEASVTFMDLAPNTVDFFDPAQGLKSDCFYEYILYGVYDGKMQTSEGLRTLVCFKGQDTWMHKGVAHKKTLTSNGMKHKFGLIAEVRSNETEKFFTFLKRNKMEDLYSEDLEDIKSKIQQFFIYKVTKRNLLTGQNISLGWHLPYTELEDKTDIMKSLNSDAGYVYTFALFTGNPSDIVAALNAQTLNNTPLHTQVTQKDIAKDLQKDDPDYASESVFKTGTVTSVRGSASNPLNLQDTGFRHTHVVPTVSYSFTIRQVVARRTRTAGNVVTWSCSGDINLIDHFIIYSTINGTTSIAGVHCNVPGASAYHFYDTRCQGGIGKAAYTVTPVTTDFKLSSLSGKSNMLNMTT